MVEKVECFETKFGSIHKTKDEAKKKEESEEVEDFAEFFADRMTQSKGSNFWEESYKYGKTICYKKKEVVEAVLDYDFIHSPGFVELDRLHEELAVLHDKSDPKIKQECLDLLNKLGDVLSDISELFVCNNHNERMSSDIVEILVVRGHVASE